MILPAVLCIAVAIYGCSAAYAESPRLYVSAENPLFGDHFAGSMVVEVMVGDPGRRDLDRGGAEPDVTVNGKALRMVQAADGNWYAYFANLRAARIADQASLDGGVPGAGLDFGVFCGRGTDPSVVGIDLSDGDGFAVPGDTGLSGFTNGDSAFSACSGDPSPSSPDLNNVVRKPKAINTNAHVPPGQIGLDPDAWPLVQLFSFGDVTVTYNPGGPAQSVALDYDEIPNVSLSLDRDLYPSGAEVFLTITDAQLNQDPTDEDSWTFDVDSGRGVFYLAFGPDGSDSANGGPGLVDLAPRLGALGFEDNGIFSMTAGSVIEFKTNAFQPSLEVTDGTSVFSGIATFVETAPNSGVFVTFDNGNESVLGVIDGVPRGISDSVTYNGRSTSIVSGASTASLTAGPGPGPVGGGAPSVTAGSDGTAWTPGTRIPVAVSDPDQNINGNLRDVLEVFRSGAIIPTLVMGDPVTLGSASDVRFYASSADPPASGVRIPSSVPDPVSSRLLIDTAAAPPERIAGFEKISVNLGVSASDLGSALADPGAGTNWVNYDLRSLNLQLDLRDISDTRMALHFGGPDDPAPAVIVAPGDLTAFQDLVRLPDAATEAVKSGGSADVFLVVDFDGSGDDSAARAVAAVAGETEAQPVVFDIFSFGVAGGGRDLNNAVYRFELRETSGSSGLFEGTAEYVVVGRPDAGSASVVESLRPTGDHVRFLVTDSLLDEEGITISYSDIASAGATVTTSIRSDIRTHSGTVATDRQSYGFGRPVTVILDDPDLNLSDDLVDTYRVIDDAGSAGVDAVGTPGGDVLLEVLIRGDRYQRCTVDGRSYGGLASTGFSLAETSPSSGVFEGVFKMPSRICSGDGTGLTSAAGGTVDVRYHDYRDAQGGRSTVSLSDRQLPQSGQRPAADATPQLNSEIFVLPAHPDTAEVVLTGRIDGHRRGVPVGILLTYPDSSSESFAVFPTGSGSYRAILGLDSGSQLGTHLLGVSYMDETVASLSFLVSERTIPHGLKGRIADWADGPASDEAFRRSVQDMVDMGILGRPPGADPPSDTGAIPSWLKGTSKLLSGGLISDGEYVRALEFLIKRGIIRP